MLKTGSPHCIPSLKGGVPISTDRSQWRNHYREPADVFLPTCGHHFSWLHYTGLPSGGFFPQGSKACCWLRNPGMMTNTCRMYHQIRKENWEEKEKKREGTVCCILSSDTTVVCWCWGHGNKIAFSLYLPIHCYKDSNELCKLITDIRNMKY